MTNESKVLLGITLSTIVLLAGAVFFFSKDTNPKSSTTKADETILIRDSSNKITSDSPKLTLVEFGDFQCPACGAFHPYIKQILNENSSQINFVFRNFPLPMHKNAKIAALAAESANLQGKYWQFHDLLYEKQSDWAETDNPKDYFKKYAQSLNLDLEKFETSLNDKSLSDKIQADISDGNTLNINSTPTFFIDGILFQGSPQNLVTQVKDKLK